MTKRSFRYLPGLPSFDILHCQLVTNADYLQQRGTVSCWYSVSLALLDQSVHASPVFVMMAMMPPAIVFSVSAFSSALPLVPISILSPLPVLVPVVTVPRVVSAPGMSTPNFYVYLRIYSCHGRFRD